MQGLQTLRSNTEIFQLIQLNSKALNTRITNNSHITEFQLATGVYQFPIQSDVVKGYLLSLVTKGFKFGTIQRKADSLHSAHKGSESPFDQTDVKDFLKGLKNMMLANDRKSVVVKHSKPISKDLLLRKVDELTRTNTNKSIRDKAIIILGYMGALRVSEIQNLRLSDLEKVEGGYLLHLYESKNLEAGEVGTKWLPESQSLLCPVNAIQSFLETFNRSEDEFLFRSFKKGDIESDIQITTRGIQKLVKSIFGVEYSAHSLRSGFATTSFELGATHSQVMAQTLHKSVSGLLPYDQSDVKRNNSVNAIL